jgi:glycosyltransferase involved in cell wall biosynthesis
MLSVLIATTDSGRPLVPTLAALIPGATAGLIREVIVADGGSRDETAEVADVAGCRLLVANGSTGARLKLAAATARGAWLLFLRPGAVPDVTWVGAAARFIQDEERTGHDGAAAFRHAPETFRSAVAEIYALLRNQKIAPEQGLLIAKDFYDRLGGHRDIADSEADLLRRLGRRRLALLTSAVSRA